MHYIFVTQQKNAKQGTEMPFPETRDARLERYMAKFLDHDGAPREPGNSGSELSKYFEAIHEAGKPELREALAELHEYSKLDIG